MIGKYVDLFVSGDSSTLQKRSMKLQHLGDLQLQLPRYGWKRFITRSMQLHLTSSIHQACMEHIRSTCICHNPTAWITCQRNMYVVPLLPNQQRSGGDKARNIQQERDGEKAGSISRPEAMLWLPLRDLLI